MSSAYRNYSSNRSPSYNRWITAGVVVLLIASLAFVGWALYDSQQETTVSEAEPVVEEAAPPPPPPPPPKYNCPLNGIEQPDRALTTRRPIVFQVDNAPAARPQSGLSQADIVYEAMAEGNITRFSAIFMCNEAATVGPIRSARLITLELVPEYDALLSNSGSSEGVAAELAARPDIPNINHGSFSGAYWRTSDRYAPHNLMSSTTGIRDAAASAGIPATASITGPAFKADSPAPVPLKSISVPYSPWADVSYQYDPVTNGWLRFIGGEPHIDALSSYQIVARNVIIQYVPVTESGIIEDAGGDYGLIFGLTGAGKVLIFQDGQVTAGQWSRPTLTAPTSYLDAAGNPIPLNVGQTWVQLVPVDFTGAAWS